MNEVLNNNEQSKLERQLERVAVSLAAFTFAIFKVEAPEFVERFQEQQRVERSRLDGASAFWSDLKD